MSLPNYMEFYNHRRFHKALEYKKTMAIYFDNLKVNNDGYEKSVKIRA